MLCVFVLTCLLFIYLAFLEYSVILLSIRLMKDKILGHTKETIDFGAMVAYFIGFAIFNLIYATLGSGINVPPLISVPPGRFGKNNKRTPLK